MPDRRRVRCRICMRHESEAGPISWRGKCGDCGQQLMSDALDQLHAHAGPVFEYWRRQSALSVGALLVDDLLPDD